MHSPGSLCRVALAFLIALVACRAVKAVPPTVGFTAIAVRNNVGTNTERQASESDGSPSRAIDGNFSTATYLTTSNTSTAFSPQHTYLDLGSAQYITGFRWSKTDSYVDPHTLSFLISTGSEALLSRTFNPVTNLHNGYLGTELVNGTFAANSIVGESDDTGLYSVTLDRKSVV